MRDENDEPIGTYNDDYMPSFVRQSIKGGKCGRFIQFYKSIISDEVFVIISKELNINGVNCEILDIYLEYENNYEEIIENEYDSHFEDYRGINEDEKSKYINNKLSNLQKLNLNRFMMDFDATSLYHSAMCDENSVYL